MADRRSEREMEEGVARDTERMRQAERDRGTLLAQTLFLGTLGLVLVIPVVAGAYLGRWLDSLVSGYSVRWTVSLIVLGLAIGIMNVYLLLSR
jgi:ATP synthase protein I